ncbi:MAG: cation transporter, partial [Ignavibacteriales bacterium]
MSHNHRPPYNRAFFIGISLNVIYIIVEFIYGLISNSMALIADAGHNLSDVLGLILAWGASYLATKTPTNRRTYGFRKSTVLASLTNAVILLIAVGAIAFESIKRFSEPQVIESETIIYVAAIGVIINGITAYLFFADHK